MYLARSRMRARRSNGPLVGEVQPCGAMALGPGAVPCSGTPPVPQSRGVRGRPAAQGSAAARGCATQADVRTAAGTGGRIRPTELPPRSIDLPELLCTEAGLSTAPSALPPPAAF